MGEGFRIPGVRVCLSIAMRGKEGADKLEIVSAPKSHPPEALARWVLFFRGAAFEVRPLKGHLIIELAVSLKRYSDTKLDDTKLEDAKLEFFRSMNGCTGRESPALRTGREVA